MRAVVGREGMGRLVASSSAMGQFETNWLAAGANPAALAELSRMWIDRMHARRPPDGIREPDLRPAGRLGLVLTLPVIAPPADLPVDERPFEEHRRTQEARLSGQSHLMYRSRKTQGKENADLNCRCYRHRGKLYPSPPNMEPSSNCPYLLAPSLKIFIMSTSIVIIFVFTALLILMEHTRDVVILLDRPYTGR